MFQTCAHPPRVSPPSLLRHAAATQRARPPTCSPAPTPSPSRRAAAPHPAARPQGRALTACMASTTRTTARTGGGGGWRAGGGWRTCRWGHQLVVVVVCAIGCNKAVLAVGLAAHREAASRQVLQLDEGQVLQPPSEEHTVSMVATRGPWYRPPLRPSSFSKCGRWPRAHACTRTRTQARAIAIDDFVGAADLNGGNPVDDIAGGQATHQVPLKQLKRMATRLQFPHVLVIMCADAGGASALLASCSSCCPLTASSFLHGQRAEVPRLVCAWFADTSRLLLPRTARHTTLAPCRACLTM